MGLAKQLRWLLRKRRQYCFKRSEEITPEQRQEIEAFGVKCIGLSGDISDFDAAGEMIQATVDQLGSIDILVNNAGITNDKLLLRMTKRILMPV